jgi:hypothetical protein
MRHGIRGATLAILGTQLGLIAAVQVGGHNEVSWKKWSPTFL